MYIGKLFVESQTDIYFESDKVHVMLIWQLYSCSTGDAAKSFYFGQENI